MILTTKAVKTGTALAPPLLIQVLPIDIVWIILILVGLSLGWMARAGRMVSNDRSWRDIKKDLLVSVLIGGGNGLLAIIIILWFGLNYLQGVGVAFICAFAGVRTLETAVRWLFKKFLEDQDERRN